jgi:Mrp family chromosome partitioning ATPase
MKIKNKILWLFLIFYLLPLNIYAELNIENLQNTLEYSSLSKVNNFEQYKNFLRSIIDIKNKFIPQISTHNFAMLLSLITTMLSTLSILLYFRPQKKHKKYKYKKNIKKKIKSTKILSKLQEIKNKLTRKNTDKNDGDADDEDDADDDNVDNVDNFQDVSDTSIGVHTHANSSSKIHGQDFTRTDTSDDDISTEKIQSVKILLPNELSKRKIIYPSMENKHLVNKFREIRTKIYKTAKTENFILMVGAINMHGGTNFVSLSMGAAFSFDLSRNILLIDCNLTKTNLHEYVDIEPKLGLADYLEDESIDINDIIYETGIQRLRMIPAGKPRIMSSELLMSRHFEPMLRKMLKRFPDRIIILNSPAMVSDSPDARLLADICDYAVITVSYGEVKLAELEQARDLFEYDKLIGVILNKW